LAPTPGRSQPDLETDRRTIMNTKTIILAMASLATAFATRLSGQTVSIPDPELRAAIQEALDLPDVDPTVQDLEQLIVLDASFRGIESLTRLEYARNLAELDLSGNNLESNELHATLATLTNLHSLALAENELGTFELPGQLSQLQILHLEENELTQLVLPPSAAGLLELYLSRNRIKDLSFLNGLANLATLDLGWNALTQFALPDSLSHLSVLNLRGNRLAQFSSSANLRT